MLIMVVLPNLLLLVYKKQGLCILLLYLNTLLNFKGSNYCQSHIYLARKIKEFYGLSQGKDTD